LFANKLVSMILRKVKRQCEATLLLVLFGLLNECVDLGGQCLNCWCWPTESHNCTSSTDANWYLISGTGFLFIRDISPELLVETKIIRKDLEEDSRTYI
jgi:hypothetical protein